MDAKTAKTRKRRKRENGENKKTAKTGKTRKRRKPENAKTAKTRKRRKQENRENGENAKTAKTRKRENGENPKTAKSVPVFWFSISRFLVFSVFSVFWFSRFLVFSFRWPHPSGQVAFFMCLGVGTVHDFATKGYSRSFSHLIDTEIKLPRGNGISLRNPGQNS